MQQVAVTALGNLGTKESIRTLRNLAEKNDYAYQKTMLLIIYQSPE